MFSVSIPSVVTEGVATTITWTDGKSPIKLSLGKEGTEQVIAGKRSKDI
jgi:hypothetical protein